MQIAVMAKIRALQRYYSEPDIDVLNVVITEMIDFSGSKNGINVKTYADVAKVRLKVEDRKRMMQQDENMI